MDSTAEAYKQLVQRFVKWAETETNIRAAFVIGSRARTDHPADEWADLDIILIVEDIRPYLDKADWVNRIGRYWLTFLEPTTDRRSIERRVLFEGGLDVDFALIPTALIQQFISSGAVPPDVADIFRRGVRVLVDRDGLATRLEALAAGPATLPPPSEAEFLNAVNDFWYHAVWVAKHLRRGELWWAKSGCDGHMKNLLCQLLEWHARATRGPTHDAWFRGRFLGEWADPRALAELRQAFAHYDEEDIWRALLATMELFRWLALETAERLHYQYPAFGAERASELVRQLHAARG